MTADQPGIVLPTRHFAALQQHAHRWAEISLCTAPAERAAFQSAAFTCYEYADQPWPYAVVWVDSPFVLALAAPLAAAQIECRYSRSSPDADITHAVHSLVQDAVAGLVQGEAMGDAVHAAISAAVDAVDYDLRTDKPGTDILEACTHGVQESLIFKRAEMAIGGYTLAGHQGGRLLRTLLHEILESRGCLSIYDMLQAALDEAITPALYRARQRGTLDRCLAELVDTHHHEHMMAGQLWVDEPAWNSYVRASVQVDIAPELEERDRAWERMAQTACCWLLYRDFLMVCERPVEIHRASAAAPAYGEGVPPRLHRKDGPAVLWPDGWGIYAIRGRRVPRWMIDDGAAQYFQ